MPLTATADDVELTSAYITNPSFEQDFTGWTNSGMQTQTNNDFSPKRGTKYVEKWTATPNKIGNCSATQTITALPAGHYRLTAAGQNIQQRVDAEQTGAVIFAGTTTTAVTTPATYEVEFDGTGANVLIGFRCTNATGNWVATDNFRLYFTGSDAAMLAKNIAQAEDLLGKEMLPAVRTQLQEATDAARQLGTDATQAQIDAAAVALIRSFGAVALSIEQTTELNKAITAAEKLTEQTMAAAVKTALLDAIAAAKAIIDGSSTANIVTATNKLNDAAAAARNSHSAYVKLETAIKSANSAYDAGKNGAAELKAAIDAAQVALVAEESTDDTYASHTAALNDAILAFRVANGTGKAPTVKTGTVIQGATSIFARGTFPSSGIRETGFCYSTTNTEPTIYDARSTQKWDNNGYIYAMEGLKAASLYYVRAYAISTGYAVGYGDVVKIYTRPMGNVGYDYDYAGDDATNARIKAACEEGVWMWNNISGIQGFHLSAHYVPGAGAGGGTADCKFGGYMRISQTVSYQRTGTILHEGSHGLGIINYTDWVNSIYRSNGDRGYWQGPRVDRVIQFLENSSTAKLNGDNIHMWPYGINGAHEDTGAPMLYRGNALVVGALAEDGIRTPNQDFIRPAYTFECQEDVKYYIKSADANRGLATAYLCETTTARPRWTEMSAEEALDNDSCAWYITFNPATCKYVIKNAATGHVLTGSGFTTPKTINASTSQMQLLSARAVTRNSGYTFSSMAYWIVNSGRAFAANANGVTAGANFDHSNAATTQRWLFLNADEVRAFAIKTGITHKTMAEPQVQIAGGRGELSISVNGQRTGQAVNVYTIDGRLVETVFVQNGATATLSLPRGIYIVGRSKVTVR
jgi:hypothetical protein